jgi:nitrite reductase/ring-hydroxylating ferredoxin subunit
MTDDTSPCTGCGDQLDAVSRRDFVSMATLSAIALTLTACGGGELGKGDGPTAAPPTTTPPTTTPSPGNPPVGANQVGVTIASYPALANVGGVAKVSNSPPVALARTATGFVAYSLKCPHQGTTVTIQSNLTLKCTNHGALFSSIGAYTGGQQRTTNLKSLSVTPNAGKTFVVVNLV